MYSSTLSLLRPFHNLSGKLRHYLDEYSFDRFEIQLINETQKKIERVEYTDKYVLERHVSFHYGSKTATDSDSGVFSDDLCIYCLTYPKFLDKNKYK